QRHVDGPDAGGGQQRRVVAEDLEAALDAGRAEADGLAAEGGAVGRDDLDEEVLGHCGLRIADCGSGRHQIRTPQSEIRNRSRQASWSIFSPASMTSSMAPL